MLLEAKAAVNLASSDGGFTPLAIACQEGRVAAARLLLDKGADVDRADQNGETSLSIAEEMGHSAVVALLEEHRK